MEKAYDTALRETSTATLSVSETKIAAEVTYEDAKRRELCRNG